MTKPGHAVGTVRDLPGLLERLDRPALHPDLATEAGLVFREKIEGTWLYATAEGAFEEAAARIREHVDEALAGWLLGAMHPLSGFVAKNMNRPEVSKDAVRAFLRRLLRDDAFDALGVFTNDRQPYLAAFRGDDRLEIERQIEYVKENIDRARYLSPDDLPRPIVIRRLRAWRTLMLQHAEYLGLGRMEAGELVAWDGK